MYFVKLMMPFCQKYLINVVLSLLHERIRSTSSRSFIQCQKVSEAECFDIVLEEKPITAVYVTALA